MYRNANELKTLFIALYAQVWGQKGKVIDPTDIRHIFVLRKAPLLRQPHGPSTRLGRDPGPRENNRREQTTWGGGRRYPISVTSGVSTWEQLISSGSLSSKVVPLLQRLRVLSLLNLFISVWVILSQYFTRVSCSLAYHPRLTVCSAFFFN